MGTVGLSELSFLAVPAADETAIRQWHELCRAVARVDHPDGPPLCWINDLGRFRNPWPGEDQTVWLARLGGSTAEGDSAVVGGYRLGLPTLDNLQNAVTDLMVAPRYRRRGIGRVLLDHVCAEATRRGRIRLIAGVDHPLDPAVPDPGACFATSCGGRLALLETCSRLDVESVDPAALAWLDQQARSRSQGYSLVQWTGGTPQRWLDDVAYLTGRMSTDAPLDELEWGAEHFDAARLRARDAAFLGRGLHSVTTGAVHAASGHLVAFTQIGGYATSTWYGGQWDTIVAPEHRGRRLGTLIKVANLRQARAHRPELRVIDTYNADSNPYMVGINQAMGFRPHSRSGEWQLDLSPQARGAMPVTTEDCAGRC